MGTPSLPVSPCQQTLFTDMRHCVHDHLALCWGMNAWLTLCIHRYHNVLTEGEADYLVQLVSMHSSHLSKCSHLCTSHRAYIP